MKKLTFSLSLLLSVGVAHAQSKPNELLTNDYINANVPITTSTALINNIHGFDNNSFQPQSILLSAKGKSIMHLTPFPGLYQIDSVMLYVRKSQLRWLNDSTAVITPIK